MMFIGLEKEDIENLEYEIISDKARLKLTRLIRKSASHRESDIEVIKQNRFVNIARNVMGKSLYILEADDLGHYQPYENAWHIGEIEILVRRPDTVQLVEILADFLENQLLNVNLVNEILEEDHCSFIYKEAGHENTYIKVVIPSIEEVKEDDDKEEHPNIRILINRMENSLLQKDFANVLHSSASVFETLAKKIVGKESVQNQSLGNFFESYKKNSKLPMPILDYILSIYKSRNKEPLAGHGSLKTVNITEEQATILCELTKAFVRIERKLMVAGVTIKKVDSN